MENEKKHKESLWDSRIDELMEPPSFPNVETSFAYSELMRLFPSGFFQFMPTIKY